MLVPVVMKLEDLQQKERTLAWFEKSKSWLYKPSQITPSKT